MYIHMCNILYVYWYVIYIYYIYIYIFVYVYVNLYNYLFLYMGICIRSHFGSSHFGSSFGSVGVPLSRFPPEFLAIAGRLPAGIHRPFDPWLAADLFHWLPLGTWGDLQCIWALWFWSFLKLFLAHLRSIHFQGVQLNWHYPGGYTASFYAIDFSAVCDFHRSLQLQRLLSGHWEGKQGVPDLLRATFGGKSIQGKGVAVFQLCCGSDKFWIVIIPKTLHYWSE
jgi:hypothetical protein